VRTLSGLWRWPRSRGAQEVPKADPRIPDGAWAKALQGHPKLLGPVEHLRKTRAGETGAVEGAGEERTRGEEPVRAGLVYTLNRAARNADVAKKFVADALAWRGKGRRTRTRTRGSLWRNGALSYDLFHDAFTRSRAGRS